MENGAKMLGAEPSPALAKEMDEAKASGMSFEDFMGADFMKLVEVQGRTIKQQIEKVPQEGGTVEKSKYRGVRN